MVARLQKQKTFNEIFYENFLLIMSVISALAILLFIWLAFTFIPPTYGVL